MFIIPIEDYKEDMETDLAKGKKDEILDLLNNYNNLNSAEQFKAIEYNLHKAIKNGFIELIKIYLSKTVENSSNTLKFKIDETKRTASLFKIDKDIEEITIPRTFDHESVEYLITSVIGTSNNIKQLKFVENSAVNTIYRNYHFVAATF